MESKAKSAGGCDAGVESPTGDFTPGASPRPAQPEASAAKASVVLIVALVAHELIVTVCEEHVERRERSIAAGDVLLQLQLVLVGELRMAVDALLEHPELVPDPDHLPEERFERDPLLLQPFPAGLEDHLPALPLARDLGVSDAELVAYDFRQHLAKLIGIHLEEVLRQGERRLERRARAAHGRRPGLRVVRTGLGAPLRRPARGAVGRARLEPAAFGPLRARARLVERRRPYAEQALASAAHLAGLVDGLHDPHESRARLASAFDVVWHVFRAALLLSRSRRRGIFHVVEV